ncbi:hypothetical protein BpJC7_30450 [Weizmannia acidilactici]|uniref:Uncharacterized protein n=1 Tax=Weizmannia acidilactici TaxID=2607726 RepID=A0A5J4JAA5_9BACI|nr:hypothetical protein BpJC7_30450 [Weizmannia acidilactici]
MAHERFQTVEGQINWNDPMYKLYEKAKRNGGWNPVDIDFSHDREDFLQLREEERIASLPLISSFSAFAEKRMKKCTACRLPIQGAAGRFRLLQNLTAF